MALVLKKYDPYVGARATAAQGAIWTTGVWGNGTQYTANVGDTAILTGYYYDSDDWFQYLQTTTGLWLYVDLDDPSWKLTKDAARVKGYTETQAQAVVDRIIKANAQITMNNLVCARFANRFSPAEQQQIRELQSRVQKRNQALQADGLLREIKQSSFGGYAELTPYLDRLMSGENVGIATWAICVIAAVVITGMGTAVYYAYKHFADEAERDIKYSKDLTRTLTTKLTEEEYQQLLSETKGIVTKARIKQAVGSYASVLTIAAFAVAGYFLYNHFKKQ